MDPSPIRNRSTTDPKKIGRSESDRPIRKPIRCRSDADPTLIFNGSADPMPIRNRSMNLQHPMLRGHAILDKRSADPFRIGRSESDQLRISDGSTVDRPIRIGSVADRRRISRSESDQLRISDGSAMDRPIRNRSAADPRLIHRRSPTDPNRVGRSNVDQLIQIGSVADR